MSVAHDMYGLLTCGKYERLFVLSAYRLTARNSSIVMCCERLECDERDDELCDLFETVNKLGPSSDTDKRAHDSSKLCSGIMPSDTELLHTVELVVVKRAGVD